MGPVDDREPDVGRNHETVLVDAAEARAYAERVFDAVGLPPSDAAVVTDALLWAELRGVASHGLMRVAPPHGWLSAESLLAGWIGSAHVVAEQWMQPGSIEPSCSFVHQGERASTALDDVDRLSIGVGRSSGG